MNMNRRTLLATVGAGLVLAPAARPTPSHAATSHPLTRIALGHLDEPSSIVLTPKQAEAGTAWCSEIASLCWTEARYDRLFTLGEPGTAVNTSTNRWFRWAREHDRLRWSDERLLADATRSNRLQRAARSSQPREGDVVLMWHWKKRESRWSSHTAIIRADAHREDGRWRYDTVDGNWRGKVSTRSFTDDTAGKIFAVITPR
ncbi:hypothetical protein GCM10027418_11460 [Mariniluteicoccus endophyticus]